MLPQKVERHFNREKLMALAGLPHPAKRLLATPIEPDSHRSKGRLCLAGANRGIAFDIQANLDCGRMKALAPIKRLSRLKIMPFKTYARAEHAAVQWTPAGTEL